MVVMMLSDIAIITVKDVDYRCIIHKIDKYEAINFLKILHLMVVGIYKKYCQENILFQKK